MRRARARIKARAYSALPASRKAKRKLAITIKRLTHHGTTIPQPLRALMDSFTWRCQCGTVNQASLSWCRGCKRHYSNVSYSRVKPQRNARSQSRRRQRAWTPQPKRSEKRKDPLRPFATEGDEELGEEDPSASQPWKNTTPHGRLHAPKVQLRSASPADSKEVLDKDELLKQIEGFRTKAGSQLPEEVKVALDKMVGSVSESKLKHTHVARSDRAKKAFFQVKNELLAMDAEWKALRDRLIARFQTQLKAYRKQRGETYKTLLAKKAAWDEAEQAIEDAVTSIKEEGLEDVPEPEELEQELADSAEKWEQMALAGPIQVSDEEEEMDKEEEDSPKRKKVNATGTKQRRF